jgi:hypothetical protein
MDAIDVANRVVLPLQVSICGPTNCDLAVSCTLEGKWYHSRTLIPTLSHIPHAKDHIVLVDRGWC